MLPTADPEFGTHMIRFIFVFLLALGFYIFIGYGLVLFILNALKKKRMPAALKAFPELTLVVPCYNESSILKAKVENCLALDYPREKLKLLFVLDGSTDGSAEALLQYTTVKVLHDPVRKGKAAALNHAMRHVDSEITVFSDCNTFLNAGALQLMARHFSDAQTGCVAGEKKILADHADDAAAAGEGMYWRYESILKKLDASFWSAVGAAGELMAIRTELYSPLPEDTVLDDFMQSMQIAARGYRIAYEPDAYAAELASDGLEEELKRKLRIAAGCWQAMGRLKRILHWPDTPALCFQYFSRRILRWTVSPFLLIAVLILNMVLAANGSFVWLLALQIAFYTVALAGWICRNRKTKWKFLFAPCYFCMMHYAVVAGLFRHLAKKQDAAWAKAARRR